MIRKILVNLIWMNEQATKKKTTTDNFFLRSICVSVLITHLIHFSAVTILELYCRHMSMCLCWSMEIAFDVKLIAKFKNCFVWRRHTKNHKGTKTHIRHGFNRYWTFLHSISLHNMKNWCIYIYDGYHAFVKKKTQSPFWFFVRSFLFVWKMCI